VVRQVISLAELEQYDLHHTKEMEEHRFLCPLSADCQSHRGASHRSLSVNIIDGVFFCHRCGASGVLAEFCSTDRKRISKAKNQVLISPPNNEKAILDLERWNRSMKALMLIEDTPGEEYLRKRGLLLPWLRLGKVRFCPCWGSQPAHDDKPERHGRSAVIFAIQDMYGKLVGAQGRLIDGNEGPRMLTFNKPGRKAGEGVFMTPWAWSQPFIMITGAPIDALSLAQCGVPAIATCGEKHCPDWVLKRCQGKRVLIGFDDDKGGEDGVRLLLSRLERVRATIEWLVPKSSSVGQKYDWNDQLKACGILEMSRELRRIVWGEEG